MNTDTFAELLASDLAPDIRVIAMPADTNPAGDIFGGWLMANMDLAAGNAAARRARGRCASVAVDRMSFHRPVLVGDEVSFFANILKAYIAGHPCEGLPAGAGVRGVGVGNGSHFHFRGNRREPAPPADSGLRTRCSRKEGDKTCDLFLASHHAVDFLERLSW